MADSSIPHLFETGNISDTKIRTNCVDPILNNLLEPAKAGYIRFFAPKLVNNIALLSLYNAYLEKLEATNATVKPTYGFIQLPDGENGEVRSLRKNVSIIIVFL